MAEENFSRRSSSSSSQNSVALTAEVASFHLDAHPESHPSIKLHFPFVTEFSSRQVLSVSKIAEIPGSLDNQSSLIYLPEVLSQATDEVDANSRVDGPAEVMFKEKVNLETADAKGAVFCVPQFDRLKDVTSEMISNVVQIDEENSNAAASLNALATIILADKEPNTEGSENISTGTNAGDIVEPDDDASPNLWMHSAFPLAETGSNEQDAAVVLDSFQGASRSATSAEHDLYDLSNQNVDENQTERQNLAGIALAASHLTDSENEIAERECFKVEGEPDPGNRLSSSHRRGHDLGFDPDPPALAKRSPVGTSTAPSSSSKVKTKRSGHLVIDGLAVKPSTSSRKSGRSKRAHSNSAVPVKHGEVKLRTKEEVIKSRLLSSADTNRRQDALNCLTDDASLCIEDLQNFNVARTKKEDVFGEASFHLTAMKPSGEWLIFVYRVGFFWFTPYFSHLSNGSDLFTDFVDAFTLMSWYGHANCKFLLELIL